MAVEIKGLRVFIASPGGLHNERETFKKTVDAWNERDAIRRGVLFIPIAWEYVLPGMGRAQEKILEELRQCDYFVMILWDRWGTPPGGARKYTSGTEEEYQEALSLFDDPTSPMREIALYFKGVDARQLSDPGPELKKVLDFRTRIESEKRLLYGTFDTPENFSIQLQQHLSRWLDDHVAPATYFHDSALKTKVSAGANQLKAGDLRSSAEVSAAYVKQADQFVSEGRYVEAELAYARAATDGSEFVPAYKYGLFLWNTGRYDQARGHLERALELAQQGETTSSSGSSDVAADVVVKILIVLARHYVANERYSEARSFYRNAVNRLREEKQLETDEGAGVLEKLAETHIKLKEYELAEPLLRNAMEIRGRIAPKA